MKGVVVKILDKILVTVEQELLEGSEKIQMFDLTTSKVNINGAHETFDRIYHIGSNGLVDLKKEQSTNTPPPQISDFEKDIRNIGDDIIGMLLEKNRKYGDAALSPIRVFASSDSKEQIRVRIDDKLNRMMNRQNDDDEDIVNDLIGYLFLLKIAENK